MTTKQQWFEAQCLKQGICAEDIFVVGDYATNKEGDFLYSVTHEEGEDTMNYVAACDLIDCEVYFKAKEKGLDLEGFYAWRKAIPKQAMPKDPYTQSLYYLMQNLEEGYRDGDMILTTRSESDWREITQVFKECMCRNQELSKEWRDKLRQKPALSIYEPAGSVQIDPRMGKYFGLRDLAEVPLDTIPTVILPEEFDGMGGYRFALKVVDIDNFIEIYSNVKYEGEHKPFRILADLEAEVEKVWKDEGKVMAEHYIDTFDENSGPGHGADMPAWFRFSHFEVDNEIDESFRTFYACYMVQFDK